MTTYTHKLEVGYNELKVITEAFDFFVSHCKSNFESESLSAKERELFFVKYQIIKEAQQQLRSNTNLASSYYPIHYARSLETASPVDDSSEEGDKK